MIKNLFAVTLLWLPLAFCSIEVQAQSADDVLQDNIQLSGITLNLKRYTANVDGGGTGTTDLISITTRPSSPDLYVTTQDGEVFEISENGSGMGTPTLWFDYDAAVRERFGTTAANNGFVLKQVGGGTAAHDGLRAIAFHPEFASNGKFYTSAMVDRPSNSNGFIYLGTSVSGVDADSLVAEWTFDFDTNSVDSSSYRELFRIAIPVFDHPVKQITFNKLAQPGDDDYGLLYIAHGDGSTQSTSAGDGSDLGDGLGKVMRINPLQSGALSHTTPGNFFANDGDSNTLSEIYSYGHRNPHNMSFAQAPDGSVHLIVAEGGRDNIEEINLIQNGADYGWGDREGTFVHNRFGGINGSGYGVTYGIDELPANDAINGFTYPSAQYDHDANLGDGFVGSVVAGGMVIRNGDPDVEGLYIFADFGPKDGNFYSSSFDDLLAAKTTLSPGESPTLLTQAEVSRLSLTLDLDGDGIADSAASNLNDLLDVPRNDVRFGQGPNGEVFMTSKRTGDLYILDSTTNSNGPFVAVYEGFETSTGLYELGTLDNQGPIIPGFLGAWNNANNASVVSAGLDYSDGLYFDETGGSINVPETAGNGRQGRLLSTTYNDSTEGTVYLSFLMQTDTQNNGSYRAFELHDGGYSDGANRRFQIGFQNGDFASDDTNYGFNASGSGGVGATALGVNNTLANLFVVKFQLTAANGGDSVTVWQNPVLTTGDDPTGGVTETGLDISFDRITLAKFGNSNGASWDELRLGNTFAEVAIADPMVLCGDVDRNGEVNFADISPFIAVLSTGEYQAEADCTGDERVTFADIAPFIAALSGS